MIGKAADGTFKSAPAKVYPPILCSALAKGFLTFCAQLLCRGADTSSECPAELCEFRGSVVAPGAAYAADYHGKLPYQGGG